MRVRSGGDDHGGPEVWLDRSEVEFLLDNADFGEQTGFVEADGGQAVFVDDADIIRRFTIALGARCGLKAEEIVAVTADDVVETPAGTRLRVDGDPGERMTPLPSWMASSIEDHATPGGRRGDSPILDVTLDTVENWIREAAERCRMQSDEEGWRHLDSRDLRRTWARLLVDSDVDTALVMRWGGWSSWTEFRRECYGACPPEVERTEASKAPWMDSSDGSRGVSTRKVSERAKADVDAGR